MNSKKLQEWVNKVGIGRQKLIYGSTVLDLFAGHQLVPEGAVVVSADDLRIVLDEPCTANSMSRPDSYFEAKQRVQAALSASEVKP